MTHPSLRAHWSFASALLSAAMTVALAAFAAAPGGISIVQAQACSPQIGIDAPAPGDTQVASLESSNVAAPPPPAQAAPAITISMDSPTAGAIVNNGQALNVSGWAVDASGAGTGVDTVRLFLDGPEGNGQALGWANYGRSRPDVVSLSGHASRAKSGYDPVWPIAGRAPASRV